MVRTIVTPIQDVIPSVFQLHWDVTGVLWGIVDKICSDEAKMKKQERKQISNPRVNCNMAKAGSSEDSIDSEHPADADNPSPNAEYSKDSEALPVQFSSRNSQAASTSRKRKKLPNKNSFKSAKKFRGLSKFNVELRSPADGKPPLFQNLCMARHECGHLYAARCLGKGKSIPVYSAQEQPDDLETSSESSANWRSWYDKYGGCDTAIVKFLGDAGYSTVVRHHDYFREVPAMMLELAEAAALKESYDTVAIPSDLEEMGMAKYWDQRYRLCRLFDHGIQLDTESWYSITPESIANHVTCRCLAALTKAGLLGCVTNSGHCNHASSHCNHVTLTRCTSSENGILVSNDNSVYADNGDDDNADDDDDDDDDDDIVVDTENTESMHSAPAMPLLDVASSDIHETGSLSSSYNPVVFDFFSGCGGNLISLTRGLPSKCKIVGIEIDPIKVDMCRSNGRVYGVDVDVKCADIYDCLRSMREELGLNIQSNLDAPCDYKEAVTVPKMTPATHIRFNDDTGDDAVAVDDHDDNDDDDDDDDDDANDCDVVQSSCNSLGASDNKDSIGQPSRGSYISDSTTYSETNIATDGNAMIDEDDQSQDSDSNDELSDALDKPASHPTHTSTIAAPVVHQRKPIDIVVMSPPWGGPEYNRCKYFRMNSMLSCGDGDGVALIRQVVDVCDNMILILPRNILKREWGSIAKELKMPCVIEEVYMYNKHKLSIVYLGKLFANIK